MLIVLDTSVLVALLLSRGHNNTREIILLARNKKIRLAASKETIRELKRVFSFDSIKKLPGYKSHLVASFIAWYQYNVEYFAINSDISFVAIRDVSDSIFLKLAVVSHAQYIISGDQDLLVIKHIQKTNIITVAEFIHLLE